MLTVKHGDEQTYSQVNVMSNSKFVQRDRDKKIQKRNKERIVVMNPETDKQTDKLFVQLDKQTEGK